MGSEICFKEVIKDFSESHLWRAGGTSQVESILIGSSRKSNQTVQVDAGGPASPCREESQGSNESRARVIPTCRQVAGLCEGSEL